MKSNEKNFSCSQPIFHTENAYIFRMKTIRSRISLVLCTMANCSALRKAENRQIEGFTEDDESRWTGSYTFIHGADPQFGFMDKVHGGKGLKWDEETRLLKKGISATTKMIPRPKFFFISGDLVEAMPGDEPLRSQQIKDLSNAVNESQIPVFAISGNHDLGNLPTNSSIESYKSVFGDDYFTFWVGGVFYIALNSQLFMKPDETQELAKEQMEWLDAELEKAKSCNCQQVIVFMHIPLFLSDSEEENTYFNLPNPLRKTLLQKFANGGVTTVFSGHCHKSAGGMWNGIDEDGNAVTIQVIVDSAIGAQLGKQKSGMSVVRINEREVVHNYYPMEELPTRLYESIETEL